MESRGLFIACALGAAVTLAGCKGGDGGTGDAGTDGPVDLDGHILTCEPPQPVVVSGCEANAEGEERLYLIHILNVGRRGEPPDTDIVPGFDVDGCITRLGGPTGCGQPDWRFDIDQNGVIEGPEEGVDNQLASPVLSAVLEIYVPLQDEVDAGNILLLLKVSGVNDAMWTDDPCVDVTLLRGSLPENAELEYDADDRLAAGQTFETDSADPLLVAQGELKNGRLLLGPAPLTLSVSIGGEPVDFPFDPAWLTFTPGSTSLDVGILGGKADLEALVTSLGGFLATLDVPLDVVRDYLVPLADLDPDESNANCSAISLGLAFAGVLAEEAE
jgi:hypothetical protein